MTYGHKRQKFLLSGVTPNTTNEQSRRSLLALISVACILSCLVLVLTGCIRQSDVTAPNGYSISCDKGKDCSLGKDGSSAPLVVGPDVDSYHIEDQYVIGHVTQNTIIPPPGIPAPATRQKAGYFIVDTKNDSLETGLSRDEWSRHLLRLGIQDTQLSKTGYE